MIRYQHFAFNSMPLPLEFGVFYLFHKAGDALPKHQHGTEEDHSVIVIFGGVEIRYEDKKIRLAPGEGVAVEGELLHTVVATADCTVTLHPYTHGRPKFYDEAHVETSGVLG